MGRSKGCDMHMHLRKACRKPVVCRDWSMHYRVVVAALLTVAVLCCAGKLKEFKAYLDNEGSKRQDIQQLRQEVEALANSFPMPGL